MRETRYRLQFCQRQGHAEIGEASILERHVDHLAIVRHAPGVVNVGNERIEFAEDRTFAIGQPRLEPASLDELP